MARIYKEYRETTNSYIFNRLHKEYQASCSRCKWHGYHSENKRWKDYSYRDYSEVPEEKSKFGRTPTYPSWKLVSKNKKQWMQKPIKKVFDKGPINYPTYGRYVQLRW
jgi:hypothetical protein